MTCYLPTFLRKSTSLFARSAFWNLHLNIKRSSDFYSNKAFRSHDAVNLQPNSMSRIKYLGTSDLKIVETNQKLLISKFISSHDRASIEDWNCLIHNVFSLSADTLNLANIDHNILHYSGKSMKLNLARSYLDYMKYSKKKFDGSVSCEFLKLCYNVRRFLTATDLYRVSKFTEFLLEKYTNVDWYIGEAIIKGLLLQNKINSCLEVLNKVKSWDCVNEETFTALIVSSIESKNFYRAREFISEMTKTHYLNSEVSICWIKASVGNRIQLDELLRIFCKSNYRPTKTICDQLIRNYENLTEDQKLKGEYVALSDRSTCLICKNQLNPIEISSADYKLLRETITSKLLVGDDVYKNTMPYELEKFHKLMDKYGPFDVIVDGLNVAYVSGQTGNAAEYVVLIEKVLRQLHKEYKILFVGKWHMRKWPGLLDILRKFDSRYFFVEDISVDDAYILCATLFGEDKTFFISRDTMTSEKLKLSREESKLFERWLHRHQMVVRLYGREIKILPPVNFEMTAQQTPQGGWHIPYRTHTQEKIAVKAHEHWLCLRPNQVLPNKICLRN